ncbi:MAG: hypothetical protein A3G33_10740 [Omnitrophica bacterium RIFCSPLOWO2_12_FULL_44_17]|uniref:Tyrosine-protein kinase G-rich domain-containing protein n=1 Tax=Candidatus Danuiimicrobium aquiferis TaxID=1801832 RepID=A0A1G1KRJ7_9BACT|nr:MAG: hypothetical protein A3B72_03060 [Omnitrophica bacterium RIFCSPHIGHO2_02_FULL_45_28]OGW90747.1 MAG: hypothetical protein A3E74_04895 [Omnitrophica bacterium RIFCSPHIGHO2_12_FULL_44_12]OGW95445.1 MAG: hypothetical protein A3G33_10740 [Omnitrophica bacterium RIFCSPLOWO2_12_FULL_44_17]OGX03325.1 MAG: hypothetical protein A3J12_07375 [Omnitrophica bacterium RIFCSPLOWO2_02_FULL_44_11]
MNLQSVGHSLRLREYYYMAVRHKFYIFLSIAVSLLVAINMVLFLPRTYRAETILLVEQENMLNPLISNLAVMPSIAGRMKTLRDELLSWQRITLLVEKLKLDKNIKGTYEYEQLIKSLRSRIGIKMRGYDIITVSFEGPDPKKAQEIVQTLGDIIIEGNITSTNLEADGAINFIDDQLAAYRKRLEESEVNLREFKEVYNHTLPVATRLNEELVSLKMELNRLLVDNTEEHPRVIQTRALITQLEKQRDENMSQAKEEGVKIDPAEYARLVSSVPRQEQELSKLQRDYAVNARIYESLLQKLETAKISQTLENSDKGTKFRILEPARLPLSPIKPNKPLILLAGLFIGLILGGVIIYVLELNDNSIKNIDEATLLLDFPIFGAIATIRPEELIMEQKLRSEASV